MRADPTDAEIEALLQSAPQERWLELWAAADQVAAGGDDATWGGGRQVDTTRVEGVEQPVLQMPYAVYSDAVNRVVESLYGLGVVVAFNWREWDGVDRYRRGAGLDEATVADAVRMTTAIIRAERFTEGTIAATLEDGTLAAALRRLRRWYDEDRARR